MSHSLAVGSSIPGCGSAKSSHTLIQWTKKYKGEQLANIN